MGKCKECRFWQATKELVCDDNQKACMCPKILGNVDGMDREFVDDKELLADATACCRGGNLMTKPDFGCVCFGDKKANVYSGMSLKEVQEAADVLIGESFGLDGISDRAKESLVLIANIAARLNERER